VVRAKEKKGDDGSYRLSVCRRCADSREKAIAEDISCQSGPSIVEPERPFRMQGPDAEGLTNDVSAGLRGISRLAGN